ncbi:MAG TPA: hypothetical protein VI636_14155 [Candidatus Angelobacter sp.]
MKITFMRLALVSLMVLFGTVEGRSQVCGPGACISVHSHVDGRAPDRSSSGDREHSSSYNRPVSPPPQLVHIPTSGEQATKINNEGVAFFNSGDLVGARAKYEEALRVDPNHRMARSNLAQTKAELAFRMKDYSLAIAEMRSAIALGRTDLDERLAYFQRQWARVEEARRKAEAARQEEERQHEIAAHDARLTATYRQVIESAKARLSAERSGQPSVPMPEFTTSSSDMKEVFKPTVNSALEFAQGAGVAGSSYRPFLEEGAEPLKSGFSFGKIFRKYVLGIASDDMQAINAAPANLAFGNSAATAADETALTHIEQSSKEFQGKAAESTIEDAANHLGKAWYERILPDWLTHWTK